MRAWATGRNVVRMNMRYCGDTDLPSPTLSMRLPPTPLFPELFAPAGHPYRHKHRRGLGSLQMLLVLESTSRPAHTLDPELSTRVTRSLMKERNQSEEQERRRIRWVSKRQSASEVQVTPGYQTHEQLWQIVRKLPTDSEPYGKMKRETSCDCSGSCRWYHVLAGRRGQDWGGAPAAGAGRESPLMYTAQAQGSRDRLAGAGRESPLMYTRTVNDPLPQMAGAGRESPLMYTLPATAS